MSELSPLRFEDLPLAMSKLIEQVTELKAMLERKPFLNGYPSNENPITRTELCKRLGVTEPTVISMERRNKIPVFYVGKLARYEWARVVQALEKNNSH